MSLLGRSCLGLGLVLVLGCSAGGDLPPGSDVPGAGVGIGTAGTGGTAMPGMGDPTLGGGPTATGSAGNGMTGAATGSVAPGNAGSGAADDPGNVPIDFEEPEGVPQVVAADVHSEAQLRRLTVREFDNTVAALLGTTRTFEGAIANDVRQQGFSRNQAQLVDPVFGGQVQQAAEELAAEVVAERLTELAPCAASPGAECAATFIRDFGALAFRRPLAADEETALLALYEAAAAGRPDAASQFAAGVQFTIEVMLQSAGFLYVQQVGELGAVGDLVALDQWEIASTLSYLITAGPPDAELRAAAADGALLTSAQRRAQAERLLATPAAAEQVRTFIKEWLRLDRMTAVDKADERFAALRQPMLNETDDFIDEVMLRDDGTLTKLLTAGYTVVGSELEAFYGVSAGADGRASLAGTGRVGILQQGSFLTANSASNESSPIIRGVQVLRRVACADVPDPATLDIVVAAPEPDPTATTRELFAAHSADPGCAMCHDLIDGVGFTFEGFGPIGDARTEQVGKTVDTTGALAVGMEMDGPLVDSADLSQKLAASVEVQRCFARHVYRYGAANADDAREDTFIRGLEAEGVFNDQVHSLLASFAASNSFLLRKPAAIIP